MQLGSHVARSQLLPLLRFIYTGQAAIACSADDAKALQRLAGKDVVLSAQLLAEKLPAQSLAVPSAHANRVASPDSQLQVLRHCTQPNIVVGHQMAASHALLSPAACMPVHC